MAEILLFDFPNKIITVPLPDITLDLQYLINSIREAEDDITPGMTFAKIADAYGKQDLGGGVSVGITVVLLDGWRVMFADRLGPDTVSVAISGGNFVGEAGANPVAPSEYTQVTVQQSSSATIAASASDTNLVYLVESLRNSHYAFGNVYYWDPYGGSDIGSGLTPTDAVKTFSVAHGLTSANNNDVIFARATDPSGTTVITETIIITKSTLKLRGPGHHLQFIPSLDTADTISISSDNVEVSGFSIQTAGTGSADAVSITGDNVLFRDCWISSARSHGINISASARPRILTSVIENCGGSGTGDGIHIGANTIQLLASKCILYNSINGINLSGSGIADNIVENCLIYKNTTVGVTIGSGVLRTTLRSANTIVNNTTSNTADAGTDTYIETPSGGESATDIADAVWNEVIADHQVAGSTGRTLRDAKTKATLASLK